MKNVQEHFLPHDPVLMNAPSRRSIDRAADYPVVVVPPMPPFARRPLGETSGVDGEEGGKRRPPHVKAKNKCRYSTHTYASAHAVHENVRNVRRRHFVDPLPNAGGIQRAADSSGITGKTIRPLGLWRLTERHVHFRVNL